MSKPPYTQEDIHQKLQTLVRCLRRLPDSLDEKRTALPIAEFFLADFERHAIPVDAAQHVGFTKTAAFEKTGEPVKVDTVVIEKKGLSTADQAHLDILQQESEKIAEELSKPAPAAEGVVTNGEE